MSITGNQNNIFIHGVNLKILEPGKGLIFSDDTVLNTASAAGPDHNITTEFNNVETAFVVTEATANTGFAGNTTPQDAISVSSNLFISFTGNLITTGQITAGSVANVEASITSNADRISTLASNIHLEGFKVGISPSDFAPDANLHVVGNVYATQEISSTGLKIDTIHSKTLGTPITISSDNEFIVDDGGITTYFKADSTGMYFNRIKPRIGNTLNIDDAFDYFKIGTGASDTYFYNNTLYNCNINSASQIPNLDASKITSGTLDNARLPSTIDQDTFIADDIYMVDAEGARITSDYSSSPAHRSNVTFTTRTYDEVAPFSPTQKTYINLYLGNTTGNPIDGVSKPRVGVATTTLTHTLTVNGDISGSGADITDLDADNISTGTINNARIPTLDINTKTSGILDNARLPSAIYQNLGAFDSVGTSVIFAGAISVFGDSLIYSPPTTLLYESDTHTFSNHSGSSNYATIDSTGFTSPNKVEANYFKAGTSVLAHNLTTGNWNINVGLEINDPLKVDTITAFNDNKITINSEVRATQPLVIYNGNYVDWYDGLGTLVKRDYGSVDYLNNVDRIIQLQGNDYTINGENGGDIKIGGLSSYFFYDYSAQRIGINTITPTTSLDVNGTFVARESGKCGLQILPVGAGTTQIDLEFVNASGAGEAVSGNPVMRFANGRVDLFGGGAGTCDLITDGLFTWAYGALGSGNNRFYRDVIADNCRLYAETSSTNKTEYGNGYINSYVDGISLQNGGTTCLRVHTNDKVGIKNTSPVFDLDVGGSMRATFLLSQSPSNDTYYLSYGIDHYYSNYVINAVSAGTYLYLYTTNGAIRTNSAFQLEDSSASGTARPRQKFAVWNDEKFSMELQDRNGTWNTSFITRESDGGFRFATDTNTDVFYIDSRAGGISRICYGTGGVYVRFERSGIEPQIFPSTTNYGRLGTSTNEWYELRVRNVYVNGVFTHSDDRLKHNEEEIVDALGTINKLKLYKYDKTNEMLDPDFNGDLGDLKHQKEIGFIAQEVAEIPELAFLVSGGGTAEVEIETEKPTHGIDEEPVEVPKETKTVELPFHLNYNGITNIAIQAIQELSAKCKSQQDVITSLIARIEALENAS